MRLAQDCIDPHASSLANPKGPGKHAVQPTLHRPPTKQYWSAFAVLCSTGCTPFSVVGCDRECPVPIPLLLFSGIAEAQKLAKHHGNLAKASLEVFCGCVSFCTRTPSSCKAEEFFRDPTQDSMSQASRDDRCGVGAMDALGCF